VCESFLLVRVFATAREAVSGVHRRTRGALVLVFVDEREAGLVGKPFREPDWAS
jgi:hypothetical protein